MRTPAVLASALLALADMTAAFATPTYYINAIPSYSALDSCAQGAVSTIVRDLMWGDCNQVRPPAPPPSPSPPPFPHTPAYPLPPALRVLRLHLLHLLLLLLVYHLRPRHRLLPQPHRACPGRLRLRRLHLLLRPRRRRRLPERRPRRPGNPRPRRQVRPCPLLARAQPWLM